MNETTDTTQARTTEPGHTTETHHTTTATTTEDPILVLGATGKTGRRIAERLEAAGHTVRRGSRTASPPFDWADPATWPAVLEGVASVYVSYFPDIAVPGAPEAIAAFAVQAERAGVHRLVLLSGRGEVEAQRAEEMIKQRGFAWTVVRASWFAQNFSEGAFLDSVLSGEVALPVGDVGEPFVDVDDLADVAVAALTEDGHHGQTYEVTGPRLLTFAEAVAVLAQASGREIAFIPIPLEAFTGYLAEAGEPQEVIDILAYLFTEVLDGRNAHVTDGVFRALGRAPRDFADYARTAAENGAWK